MAQRARRGLQFFADWTPLEKSMGNAWASISTPQYKDYQQNLVETAFWQTNQRFNEEAAAYAAAGGKIRHMFEWGTAGINTGRTNMRPNPLSERARLWQPYMEGSGLTQQFDFHFKPSVAFVPKPTARDTGMSPQVIEMLRDHVFWNKAMVMETGMTVNIKPVEAEFLLLPLDSRYDWPAARANDFKRGYMLSRGPLIIRPGANVAGNFNNYWVRFWNSQGNDLLNESVQAQLDEDFETSMRGMTTGGMRPVVPEAVTRAIKTEKKRQETNARRRAAYRAKKAIADAKS